MTPRTTSQGAGPRKPNPPPEAIRIMKLRERLGLTRAQFAFALSTTEPTVWRWEAGLAKPEGAAAALLNALEQQTTQIKPQENLGEIIGQVAMGAAAGVALLALLVAIFGGAKK